jgi:effector-binding domain-containing protein
LPTLEDDEDNEKVDIAEVADRLPWSVTAASYHNFRLGVQIYGDMLPTGCSLLSKNTLARDLEIYFKYIQKFLPIIYLATFSAKNIKIKQLLVMIVLSVLYRFEYSKVY